MLVPRAVPAWSGATRCARSFAVIRGSSKLLQGPDIDISHAVPLRCSTGPHCEAGDEAELSGMGHWSVQSRRGGEGEVFYPGHVSKAAQGPTAPAQQLLHLLTELVLLLC